ncbi:hypothetical protein ACN94_21950 [Gordonia paraffinivorans]|nr:hypothetical protein [Gordonia paraffinivorans]
MTDRQGCVQNAWVALASAIIIIRRLVRQSWKRYRWDSRPARCP